MSIFDEKKVNKELQHHTHFYACKEIPMQNEGGGGKEEKKKKSRGIKALFGLMSKSQS